MSSSTDTRTLVVERDLKHPPEKVWRALTEGPLLEQWLLKGDFRPVVGHRFTFQAPPNPHWDGVVPCEVTTVEPPARLALKWMHWVVTWTLTATAGGTLLRMEQAPFGPDESAAYAGAKYGWTKFLAGLDELLARL